MRRLLKGIAIAVALLLALRVTARFWYGSEYWTEEVRLANGLTIQLDRENQNGPGAFFERCSGCIAEATYSGEHLGRRFEWSTDRRTLAGHGPLALEFAAGDPMLVFAVSGRKDCERYGWPDPPLRVQRLAARGWLPDRWVDATPAELPQGARVNLFELHRKNWDKYEANGLLTAAEKDVQQSFDENNLHPHGELLSAVGAWLNATPDSCRSLRNSASVGWRDAKRAIMDSEAAARDVVAELIEGIELNAKLSARRVREQRGLKGPTGLTRGCREQGIRVATLGQWVVLPNSDAGGQLDAADVLVTPLPFDDAQDFAVIPGPLSELRLVVCKPDELLVVREAEPYVFLVTRLGPQGRGADTRRVTVDVPGDLGGTPIFWSLAEDGHELQMATYWESQSYEFDGVRSWHGGSVGTMLRYQVR